MVLLVLLFAATSLLFVLLSIPLIRGRIPRNTWYGLRVPATLADDAVWYEANARTGWDMLRLGVVLLLLAVILPLLGIEIGTYVVGWSGATTLGAVVMAAVGWGRANRLLRERQDTAAS